MVSKNDLLVGALVLIAGIIIYQFAPGGALFMKPPDHTNTHYVGSVLALVFGLVGVALYKKVNKVTLGVSILAIILGIVFLLDAPGMALYSVLTPHGQAMQAVGAVTSVVGLVGIIGSAALKK